MSEVTENDAMPDTELRPGWIWATVEEISGPMRGAITDGPFGSNLKTSHYTSSGPRVIRLQNIGDGVFRDSEAHISDEHFQRLRRHEAIEGDLIIAALGENFVRRRNAGEVGLVLERLVRGENP